MRSERPAAPRIPLIASTSNRGEHAFDARIVNGYVEKLPNGEIVVVKRPGFSLWQTLTPGVPGGCYYWNGHLYSIVSHALYKDGISIPFTIPQVNIVPYSFASTLGATPKLVFHNDTVGVYTYDGTTLAYVNNTFTFVQGFAFLDGTLYGASAPSGINGSGLNDPATWNALNVIQAQQEPDFVIATAKQLQYVVVYKNWTTEAFWDAGNPTGSPLQSAQGTLLFFGCRHGNSVQNFENVLIWVSATRNGSVAVMTMENMQPKTISTPAVERLLQAADWTGQVYSWCARINGHRFYCITPVNSNISLVYDFTTELWFQWASSAAGGTAYLPYVSSTTTSDKKTVLQHENGSLYVMAENNYTDAGAAISLDIYTPTWDGGTRKRKFLKRMEVIADQVGGEYQTYSRVGTISWSDDDYQTWSNPRKVDLSKKRPFLDDLGTFYKRAFHFTYNAPTPFRAQALELTSVMEGSE